MVDAWNVHGYVVATGGDGEDDSFKDRCASLWSHAYGPNRHTALGRTPDGADGHTPPHDPQLVRVIVGVVVVVCGGVGC